MSEVANVNMINQMETTRKTHKIKYGLSFPCLPLCHPPVYLIFLPQLKSRKPCDFGQMLYG